MSSSYVRDTVKDWLAANSPLTTVLDLADINTLADLPPNLTGAWIAVQFVSAVEERVSIGPEACWREEGIFFVHVVVPAGFNASAAIAYCETIRAGLRGNRLAPDMYVRSVDPPSDAASIALGLDGPWKGWAVVADYYRDLHA